MELIEKLKATKHDLNKATSFEERSINYGFNDGIDAAIEIVKAHDPWIPVTDEVIPFGMYNVAYFNPNDENNKFYLYVVTVWRVRGYWSWDSAGEEPAENDTLKISHYQPLPAPPKNK